MTCRVRLWAPMKWTWWVLLSATLRCRTLHNSKTLECLDFVHTKYQQFAVWGCWKPKVMSAPHKGYGACLCWTAVMELHMPGSWALVCHGETVFTRKDSVVVIQERDAQLIMYVIYILSFYSTNYDFSSVCLCSEMLSPPSMPDAKRMQKSPRFATWMALNAENFETLLISCSIPSSFSHKICRPFL